MDEKKYDFLKTFIEQNLEHARHVENERMTFTEMYLAFAGAIGAFLVSEYNKSPKITIMVSCVMIFIGLINLFITFRWQNVFDQHINRAKELYAILHKELYPNGISGIALTEEKDKMAVKGNNFNEMPAYCFNPLRKRISIGTKKLFIGLDFISIGVFVFLLIYTIIKLCCS